ncbi:alkyldihydroxyacetonephosphate synthase [Haloechinothrix alba]|uniref:Alkyldihydroxyacetonephosphate synthase n=1 Tax=Haloechinothrix alba TaxID=664784 RepID=A0A238VBF8_9PSEU|nr:FAD-binding oxidoreductase [Haloechinothrix alba]SNR31586.1 alkyldihydroxyacetonephosphate synthase [Haloechinothrix alba]
MNDPARSWWGWGRRHDALSDAECVELAHLLPGLAEAPLPVPDVSDLHLPAPRLRAPTSLEHLCSADPADRAAHTFGQAYRDVVRALYGQLSTPPDLVAYPRGELHIVELLDWAMSNSIAVIPYGGGSSVVGGVEYRGGDHRGTLSLDLSALGEVLEVDPVNRAARIQAGAFGPALEDQLRPHGYTLRHFPQSFEFSTLGGWLATRAAGHYATLHTHIDDFVESLRVLTPAGTAESLRLPSSGAGPSPDRMFLGSEGTLGVITEAWMRVQDRPRYTASTPVSFAAFGDALEAVRAIAQSGLHPSNCRLLDPGEALLSGAAGGGESVLVLGFESAHFPVDEQLAHAVELAGEHGGRQRSSGGSEDDAVRSWRSAFLRMPYQRDGLARMSAIVETFETSCTWDRALGLYEAIQQELGAAVTGITGATPTINCRLTHVYPDGPAPYFTVIVPGRRGSEVAQWDEIKAAAGEILHSHRASITHHHAVGRDHRPWYDRQRPELFASVLRAAKHTLDPHGILNPGVLVD